VIETHGLYGGLFADRKTALRYAKFESGGSQRSSIETTSDQLEFKPGTTAR
jgi:hypothetical protein